MLLLLTMTAEAVAGEWSSCWKTTGAAWSQDLAKYHSAAELDAEAAQSARMLMDDAPSARPSQYPYGTVEVIVRRVTIETANFKYVNFIWVDGDGRKVSEIKGQDRIGEPPPAPGPLPGSAAYWWNVAVVPLPSAEASLTLHVVDTLARDKCTFEITRAGRTGVAKGNHVQ